MLASLRAVTLLWPDGANDAGCRARTLRSEEELLSETQPRSELSAVGVVTGHTFRPGHGGSTGVIFPSVRFQTADGRTVEFQNGVGSNAPPKVGEEVTVYYDPERSEDAKLSLGSTFRPNLKLLPVVFGIFFGVVALMFLSVFALVVLVSLS
jgi:hypothetical protein